MYKSQISQEVSVKSLFTYFFNFSGWRWKHVNNFYLFFVANECMRDIWLRREVNFIIFRSGHLWQYTCPTPAHIFLCLWYAVNLAKLLPHLFSHWYFCTLLTMFGFHPDVPLCFCVVTCFEVPCAAAPDVDGVGVVWSSSVKCSAVPDVDGVGVPSCCSWCSSLSLSLSPFLENIKGYVCRLMQCHSK